jgi:hypothetical protein
VPRTDDAPHPQPVATTAPETPAAGRADTDVGSARPAPGLPWSGGNVLTIDTDGTAFVDCGARPGMTGVWTIAAPVGTRSVTSALPLDNALEVPAYRAREAREWALGHDQCSGCA